MSDTNRFFHSTLGSPSFQLHWTAAGHLRKPHETPPWTKLEYWIILSPQNGIYQGKLKSGESLSARGREILLIPPGREYSLALTAPGKILGAGVSFSLLGNLDISHVFRFPFFLDEEEGENLFNALEQLCLAHRTSDKESSLLDWLKGQAELEKSGYTLYSELMNLADFSGEKSHDHRVFLRLLPLLEYMNNHNTQKMPREEMGNFLGVSPQRIHSLFKESFGFSPGEYERRNRLEGARKSLADHTKSIAQVSEEFNYCDPFHFSKQFKSHYGISPREYRQGKDVERVLGYL